MPICVSTRKRPKQDDLFYFRDGISEFLERVDKFRNILLSLAHFTNFPSQPFTNFAGSNPSAFRSASTIRRTSCLNPTLGFHFRVSRAFLASPMSRSTSVGRKYLASILTESFQS